jgi:transposase
VAEFATTRVGHARLLDWLVGLEGTGSYGAGVARFLRGAGIEVVEVDRPNRQTRRRTGKSDPADAIEAARAALSGRAQGAGKTKDGNVEAIRALMVAKRSARSSKIQALNQIRQLGFTASDELRVRLDGISRQHLGSVAASLRPRAGSDPVTLATKTALSTLGRRVLALDEEKQRLDVLLGVLVAKTAPSLLALQRCRRRHRRRLARHRRRQPPAAALRGGLGTPVRGRTDRGLLGQGDRYRLNRGGDRHANAALRGIVITRLRSDWRTQTYMERRLKRAAPSRRSSASSSATSPARSTTTFLAANSSRSGGPGPIIG